MTRRKLIAWVAGLSIAWAVSILIAGGSVLAGIRLGISHGAWLGLLGSIGDLILPYRAAGRFFDGPRELCVLLAVVVAGLMQWLYKRLSGDVGPRTGTLAAIGWSTLVALSPAGAYIVKYLPDEPLSKVAVAFCIEASVSFVEAFIVTGILGQLLAAPFLGSKKSPEGGAAQETGLE